jgi:hypothetical protein
LLATTMMLSMATNIIIFSMAASSMRRSLTESLGACSQIKSAHVANTADWRVLSRIQGLALPCCLPRLGFSFRCW